MNRTRLINNIFLLLNILSCIAIILSIASVKINPIDNLIMPLFGLAYPFLLVINILFIIFWAIRKRRYYFISLVCILLGFGSLSKFFQINFYEEQPRTENDIEILTYNVRLFGLYDEDNGVKRDQIFDYIVEEAPDVMCFQEFYHTDNKKGFITRDKLLEIQDAQYLHEKYTHEFRHKQNFGVVTISKFPIVFRGYIPFEGDINNFCIYSDILMPSGDTVRVYNAHLASIRFQKQDYEYISGEQVETNTSSPVDGGKRIIDRLQSAFEKRSVQIKKVMDNIKESPYPTILTGDFNDTPISYCYSQINSQLEDAFMTRGNGTGYTYNGSFPALRIDYVFHSDDLICNDFNVFRKDLSDHFSINARFQLKGKDE